MLYAPLAYFVIFLGSMGIGEDLFYMCGAPSEEIDYSLHFSGNFSLKPRKLIIIIIFLDNYSLNHSTNWLIPAIVFLYTTVSRYEHTMKTHLLQRVPKIISCWIVWCAFSYRSTNTACLCGLSVTMRDRDLEMVVVKSLKTTFQPILFLTEQLWTGH